MDQDSCPAICLLCHYCNNPNTVQSSLELTESFYSSPGQYTQTHTNRHTHTPAHPRTYILCFPKSKITNTTIIILYSTCLKTYLPLWLRTSCQQRQKVSEALLFRLLEIRAKVLDPRRWSAYNSQFRALALELKPCACPSSALRPPPPRFQTRLQEDTTSQADVKIPGLGENSKKINYLPHVYTKTKDISDRQARILYCKKSPTLSFSEHFFQIHISHTLNYSINNMSISLAQWGESSTQNADRAKSKAKCE